MKILIAEDEPTFRQFMVTLLTKWGYEVIVARNGNEAWRVLQSDEAPQLAILDWMMPGMNGIDICRKVREEVKEPYCYIILLTGQRRDQDLVAGMEAGADDYIFKPVKNNELNVRIRAGRRIIELQNDLLSARDNFQNKASHDSLTGLWNHEEIIGIFQRELARAEREGEYVSVIMADLDKFKMVNDTYGHMAGDKVLSSIAQRILGLTRSYDFVGRYGGEEFMLVLPKCCRECTVAFAERLRSAIADHSMDISEGMIPVTISLGVASNGKEVGWDADSLIKAADAALYRAKENGRNRVEIATDKEKMA